MQYDTLPQRVAHAADLEPGDLVFYSGECYEPGSRRHHFDMTHVEVFVGGDTGEATIGVAGQGGGGRMGACRTVLRIAQVKAACPRARR